MSLGLINPLKTLLDKTIQEVLGKSWVELLGAQYWQNVVPCPEDLPKPYFIPGQPRITEAEQRLQWALWATDFYNKNVARIEWNSAEFERHLMDELAVWNRYHTEKNEQLSADRMYRQWINSINGLTLVEFTQMNISVETVRLFLAPKFEEIKNRYGLHTDWNSVVVKQQDPTLTPSTTNDAKPSSSQNTSESDETADPAPEPKLSLRQIALLYIYRGKVIRKGISDEIARNYKYKSGEKLYKHYQSLVEVNDRISVNGGAVRPLVKDISAVMPYLDDTQRQQAETERKTIRMRL